MEKKKKSGRMSTVVLLVFLGLFLAAIVYFFYGLLNDKSIGKDEGKKSEYQKLVDKNLDESYPATEREVVKVYCRIMKEMYSGECDDDGIQALFAQMRKLYDDELLANNSYEEQYKELKKELDSYADSKKKIVNYTIEDSDGVEHGTYKNREQALVDVQLSLKESSDWQHVNQQFVLRKDSEGRWKILGWYQIDSDAGEKNE